MASKPQLALIEWLDHSSLEGGNWQLLENAETLAPVIIQSVGWLVREDKETIVLIPHLSMEQSLCFGEICILRRAIIKQKRLRG